MDKDIMIKDVTVKEKLSKELSMRYLGILCYNY